MSIFFENAVQICKEHAWSGLSNDMLLKLLRTSSFEGFERIVCTYTCWWNLYAVSCVNQHKGILQYQQFLLSLLLRECPCGSPLSADVLSLSDFCWPGKFTPFGRELRAQIFYCGEGELIVSRQRSGPIACHLFPTSVITEKSPAGADEVDQRGKRFSDLEVSNIEAWDVPARPPFSADWR